MADRRLPPEVVASHLRTVYGGRPEAAEALLAHIDAQEAELARLRAALETCLAYVETGCISPPLASYGLAAHHVIDCARAALAEGGAE